MAIEIVDWPIKNGPVRYVSLPEGTVTCLDWHHGLPQYFDISNHQESPLDFSDEPPENDRKTFVCHLRLLAILC